MAISKPRLNTVQGAAEVLVGKAVSEVPADVWEVTAPVPTLAQMEATADRERLGTRVIQAK